MAKPHQKGSKKRIAIDQRKAMAMELRLTGMTFQAIAAELGVSKQQIQRDVQAALRDLSLETMEKTLEYRGLITARREQMIKSHWQAANDPNDENFAACAAIVERNLTGLSRLHGLDAPEVRQHIIDTSGGEAEKKAGVVIESVAVEGLDFDGVNAELDSWTQDDDGNGTLPHFDDNDRMVEETEINASDH